MSFNFHQARRVLEEMGFFDRDIIAEINRPMFHKPNLPNKQSVEQERTEDQFRRGLHKSQWIQKDWTEFWELVE